jgi:hypothetical protein
MDESRPQIQPDHMEVHHHPDLHHRKKRWKEYLLEFLMIFLAVTLGFFAESLREHISEKDRAEVFSKSLSEDFTADSTTLHQLIVYTNAKITSIDSLGFYIHSGRRRYNDSVLYNAVLLLISTFQFDNINGTYEQIKNSGSLRFFSQSLINDLNRYDATALKLKLMEEWENKFLFEKVIPLTSEMFNYKVFNDMRKGTSVQYEMYQRNMKEENVNVLLNQAETIKRLRERQLVQHSSLLQRAEGILAGLQKEYQ